MRSVRLLVLAAIGGIGFAVAAACGNSTSSSNPPDAGSSSSGSSGSSSGGSGSSSSGTGSSSSGSGADGGDDGGGPVDDGGPTFNNCPGITCPGAGANCCLVTTDAGLFGECQTPSACSALKGAFVMCGNTPDTVDCPADGGTTCCLEYSDAGGLPSSYCATSCPAGSPYACSNGDPTTCPAGGNWACEPLPGQSQASTMALGVCTPSDAGPGEGGTTDGGDGGMDGGTDAPVDTGTVTDAGGQ
jgi:hypothetical protein